MRLLPASVSGMSIGFVLHAAAIAEEASAVSGSIQSRFLQNKRMLSCNAASWRRMRGGSTETLEEDQAEDEDADEDSIVNHPEYSKLLAYRMEQQVLLQLRGTLLSETMAKRGVPIPTIVNVATPSGAAPPKQVDWDCAMSTPEEPKDCMYNRSAQPFTKVIAPIGTDDWLTLTNLNRLRRADPSKVEGMWHSKFAILDNWFSPDSKYSILQHVGLGGLLLNFTLHGARLYVICLLGIMVSMIICLPILEVIVSRFLVSSFVWSSWPNWARYVHAALPLKLLLGQLIYKMLATLFVKVVKSIKTTLIEVECQLLESRMPLTVGPGSEVVEEISDDSEAEMEGDDAENEYAAEIEGEDAELDLDSSSDGDDAEEEDDNDDYFDNSDDED